MSIDCCCHCYHERHSCHLDCCPAEKVGEENFKGVYEYDAKLVSTLPTVKSCTYNENQTFSRFCFAGLFNLPQWSAMNLTVCDTKTETTKELLAIHEVKYICRNFPCSECHEIPIYQKRITDDVARSLGNYLC